MKYYSLYSLLMFLKHEVDNRHITAKTIMDIMESESYTDEETRILIDEALHKAGMFEEGYHHKQKEPQVDVRHTDEIKMLPDTYESLMVVEEFVIPIQDKEFHITICLS